MAHSRIRVSEVVVAYSRILHLDVRTYTFTLDSECMNHSASKTRVRPTTYVPQAAPASEVLPDCVEHDVFFRGALFRSRNKLGGLDG